MFLIIQNDSECPAGSCAPILVSSGHSFRTIASYDDSDFPDPSSLTGIIVLGGTMGVHDTETSSHLLRVQSFMKEALRCGTPLLGICLGGQLLAHVAGGTVSSPSPHGEKGVCGVELNDAGASDPLFAGVDREFLTFQLHDDSFTVPPGALLLASSQACPAQAFRLGTSAYGLQFHPEVTRTIVSSWGELFSPPRDYLSRFLAHEPAFKAASQTILANFVALASGLASG